jgi:hypothetical protein
VPVQQTREQALGMAQQCRVAGVARMQAQPRERRARQ